MHRLFREHLVDATGTSEFVVAQNIDIRGFSDWSLKVDSAQTALYIKKVYARLIDEYFADASFVKPTGDGLLVVRSFEEDELSEVAVAAVDNAVRIVDSFASIVDDDPMINFEVPKRVGIGISRGTASRLASAKHTLDYSGRVLNLASRLMDIARPKGVVFDEGFGIDLLPLDLSKRFTKRDVYLSGIAPRDPLSVYCWPSGMKIPAANLAPMGVKKHVKRSLNTSRRELEQAQSRYFSFPLDPEPLIGSPIECVITHDSVTPGKRRSKTRDSKFTVPAKRHERGGELFARIDQPALAEKLERRGLGPSWPVLIEISYRSG